MMKKFGAMKDVLKAIGEESISYLISNALDDDSSCVSDLNLLNSKSLFFPDLSENIIIQSCLIYVDPFSKFDSAHVECNFEKSFSYYFSFKSSCNDSKFHTVLASVETSPGKGNLYVEGEDGILYELSLLKESNLPQCLPKSCNYDEAVQVLNNAGTYIKNQRGYDDVTFGIDKDSYPNPPTSSIKSIVISSMVTTFFIVCGALLVIRYKDKLPCGKGEYARGETDKEDNVQL
jgi:hypothetical protein